MEKQRLEELVGLLISGMVEDDLESAVEYFDETLELTQEEVDELGINDIYERYSRMKDVSIK